jgi:hypothetical protein
MREVPVKTRFLDVQGLQFHVATLQQAIPDGPAGIWIENNFVSKNPVLRQRTKRGVVYRFVAFHELDGIPAEAPIRLFHKLRDQSMPGGGPFGNSAPLEVYAECVDNTDKIAGLIEQAIAESKDPPELTDFVEQVLTDAYGFSCEFVNLLRQDFGQYWLRTPHGPLAWNLILHYSKPGNKWFAIDTPEEFAPRLLGRHWNPDPQESSQPHVLLKIIAPGDLKTLQAASKANEPTFAEEMIATALVELHKNRLRSAILHSFIGYESAAKRGLDVLLEQRLKGLGSAGLVDQLSREVSTVTLGRVVLEHAEAGESGPPLAWEKINALYKTRNGIVHRNQQRMPSFENLKEQILEVLAFIKRLQSALKSDQRESQE